MRTHGIKSPRAFKKARGPQTRRLGARHLLRYIRLSQPHRHSRRSAPRVQAAQTPRHRHRLRRYPRHRAARPSLSASVRPALRLYDVIARIPHGSLKYLTIDRVFRTDARRVVCIRHRGPNAIESVEGVRHILRAAAAAHTANKQFIAIGIVRHIGVRDPLDLLSARPIAATACAMRRCDNTPESKK